MLSTSEPGVKALLGGIPPWNSREFSYVGSTNNVSEIVYKQDGTTVATATYTYVNDGAADDDYVASETIALA